MSLPGMEIFVADYATGHPALSTMPYFHRKVNYWFSCSGPVSASVMLRYIITGVF